MTNINRRAALAGLISAPAAVAIPEATASPEPEHPWAKARRLAEELAETLGAPEIDNFGLGRVVAWVAPASSSNYPTMFGARDGYISVELHAAAMRFKRCVAAAEAAGKAYSDAEHALAQAGWPTAMRREVNRLERRSDRACERLAHATEALAAAPANCVPALRTKVRALSMLESIDRADGNLPMKLTRGILRDVMNVM